MSRDPKSNLQQILDSPSYREAAKDLEFLSQDNLRGTRLLLEYNKVEYTFKEHGIDNTIIIFGSARYKEDNTYYQEARKLAALIAKHCSKHTLICSGGGPGIMEAVNRGAFERGVDSIGLNIDLPHEQYPNPYITPELCFRFHYFAIRKMHFLRRARAIIAFPGGFGTLDELFEGLTLIQTGKSPSIPVIMFDRHWWENVINFDALVDAGTIHADDLNLFDYAQTAEEAWGILCEKTLDLVK
jgi:uncharacterized protein (TIGR00730 family)